MELPIIRPMEPVLVREPFDDPAWIYQVKWDGIRILLYMEEGRVILRTRRGQDRTAAYPELVTSCVIDGKSVILDGEVIALDERGRPSFPRVLRRHLRGGGGREKPPIPVYYVVFDLLHLDGRWLFDTPLAERQALLGRVVEPTKWVQLCDSHSSGTELFTATQRLGLEGIVAKEMQGRYHQGRRHSSWRKIKHFKELDVIVSGVILKQGRANALLVSAYGGGELTYVGRVASGLTSSELGLFTELAEYSAAAEPELANSGQIPRKEDTRWLSIRPVVRVRFLEWTEQGVMRNPVFIGLSSCKEADCKVE